MSSAGENSALLVQLPNALTFEPPFATIPVLTSALRSHGYSVVQRDLNMELLLRFLEGQFLDLISDTVSKRLDVTAELRGTNPLHNPKMVLSALKLATRMSRVWVEQARRGVIHPKTVSKIARAYRYILRSIWELSRPVGEYEIFFDKVDNSSSNLFIPIFEELFAGFDWKQVSLLGITVGRERELLPACTLAKLVREQASHVHIVMGGDLFSEVDLADDEDLRDLEIIATRYAHSIVRGEGETAIIRIMAALTKGESWDEVPNLIRIGEKGLSVNRRLFLEKAEDIPIPDFDGMPVDLYQGLPIEVSRGCYWGKCTFCNRAVSSEESQEMFVPGTAYYRSLKAAEIVRRVKHLKDKYGKSYFSFVCLDVSPGEMERLCHAIIDEGLDISWCSRLRLEKTFKPELLDLMAKAGAHQFHLHPETLCQETADLHNKGYRIDHVKKIIQYWERNQGRLPPMVLNVFTGFPGETLGNFLETLRTIEKGRFFVQSIHMYRLTKNSPVYRNPGAFGLRNRKSCRNRDAVFRHFEPQWDERIIAEKARILKARKKSAKMTARRSRRIGWFGWDNPGLARHAKRYQTALASLVSHPRCGRLSEGP